MPMKPGMKMMVMQRMAQDQNQNRSERSEYGGNRRMIGYDREGNGNAARSNYGNMEGGSRNRGENRMAYDEMEGRSMNYGERSAYGENRMAYGMEEPESRRRRDSRGRFMEGDGWEGNRGYPRGEYDERKYGMEEEQARMGGYGAESRRRRDGRGRYAMYGMEEAEAPEMRQQTWYPPANNMYPMDMHPGNSYGDIYAHGTIYAPDAMNKPMGKGHHESMKKPVDEQTARHWVEKMEGGEKFSPDLTDQLRNSHCPECKKWEFYTAINMMYSDYCSVAKKLNVDRADFYALMAKAFLEDEDAGEHKLRKYMETIPE